MENTLENKAKFFALYWEQKVMKARITNPISHHKFTALMNVDINADTLKENWFLELTPLSQITDEDATEVVEIVKILGIYSSAMVEPQKFLQPMKESKGTIHIVAPVVDYLRSKGYAVPYMGLSVEQLISFGWVKLKE